LTNEIASVLRQATQPDGTAGSDCLLLYMLPMLYIELAIVVALILLNGLFALAELAVVSSRRARLQALVDREALRDPEKIAVRVAPAMTVMARIASPIVSLLDISGPQF